MTQHNPDHLVCCGFPIIVDRGNVSAPDGIYLRRSAYGGLPYLSCGPRARVADVTLAALAASRGEYLTNDRSATSAQE